MNRQEKGKIYRHPTSYILFILDDDKAQLLSKPRARVKDFCLASAFGHHALLLCLGSCMQQQQRALFLLASKATLGKREREMQMKDGDKGNKR